MSQRTQTIIAEPRWIGTRRTGRPAWYQAGHHSYLGSKAAAERLGVTRVTFYKWVKKYPSDLPGQSIDSGTFYLSSDLDSFYAKRRLVTPDARGRKLKHDNAPA